MTNSNQGKKLIRDNFEVEVKYSEEAIKDKLIKFRVTKGDEVVIKADDLMAILASEVNAETLSAAFVDTTKIHVVKVHRQIKCTLDKDYKKGAIINIGYVHPYPIEYAIIEEGFRIAQIVKNSPVTELSAEFLAEVRKQISPRMVDFTEKFYESFNSLDLKKNKMENTNGEKYEGTLGKYKVIGGINMVNPETGMPEGEPLELGSVHEVPTALGDDWVANGLAEKVTEESPAETVSEEKSGEEAEAA